MTVPLFHWWKGKGKYNYRAFRDLRIARSIHPYYIADHLECADSIETLTGDAYGLELHEGVVINIVCADELHYKMEAYHQNGDLLFEVTDESSEIIRYEWKNQTKGARSVVKRNIYKSIQGL